MAFSGFRLGQLHIDRVAGPGPPRAASAAATRCPARPAATDPPASGRLQPAKAPGQATGKVSLRSTADVDDEILHLLRIGYDQGA